MVLQSFECVLRGLGQLYGVILDYETVVGCVVVHVMRSLCKKVNRVIQRWMRWELLSS